jgi:hypothetical protein
MEENIGPALIEDKKDGGQSPDPPKMKMSIFDILGLLIVLSGILVLLAVLFFDPLRDILAHRPISENIIGTNGTIAIWCAFIQILVGTGIIIGHMILKGIRIQAVPPISWK